MFRQTSGQRRHFGNMILSRLPVGQVFRHLLPYPVDPGVNGMPRIAVEAVIDAPFGPVRVITTHLEYYGTKKRAAQVEALRTIYAEGSGHARLGGIVDTDGGPFHTPTASRCYDHHRRFQSRTRRSAARAAGRDV